MNTPTPRPGSTGAVQGAFRTTQWSVVLAARQEGMPQAVEAWGQLCRVYWYPVYAYVRRRGHDAHQAQDLTQEFFARMIESRSLKQVGPEKGRFRTFLLTALGNFLHNEWNARHAQKRGGGYKIVSWDELAAEERYGQEPAHDVTAEKLFDRRWAFTILDNAMAALEAEYRRANKHELFGALAGYLSGSSDGEPYATVAARLKTSEAGVRMAVRRLRQRFGELLRREVAQTVGRFEDVEEELRYLLEVVGT